MNLLPIVERRRLKSPAVTPQALAWEDSRKVIWLGSRDLRRIYALEPKTWKVIDEREAPGIPWAAVATGDAIQFALGEGPEDDRYLRRFESARGWSEDRIACPDLTGSYLSFDGEKVYLSQWYPHRILQLGQKGAILKVIKIGAEICGHTFVDGQLYVLRGTEQNGEAWTIASLNPKEATPKIRELAKIPFACRSLSHDGENFWANHRAADECVSFALPEEKPAA